MQFLGRAGKITIVFCFIGVSLWLFVLIGASSSVIRHFMLLMPLTLEPLPHASDETKQKEKDSETIASKPHNVSISFEPLNNVSIPLFYNVFLPDKSQTQRVLDIVLSQMAMRIPEIHHPLFITSIGAHLEIPLAAGDYIDRIDQGDELLTLNKIWSYCKEHEDAKVVYLHAKGSFHPSHENTILRSFLTRGALSRECANLPGHCDVCSSRMSPLPNAHTPGNMFLARCAYVAKLLDPFEFQVLKASPAGWQFTNLPPPWCYGGDRFAAEHWVHSHPSVRPCDLYSEASYLWGYRDLPKGGTFDPQLAPAPRHSLEFHTTSPGLVWLISECWRRYSSFSADCNQALSGVPNPTCRTHLAAVLDEFKRLYQQCPSLDWWGWRVLF